MVFYGFSRIQGRHGWFTDYGFILIVSVCIAFPSLAVNLIKNDIVVGLSDGGDVMLMTFVFTVAYEVGYIINRLSSVLLEELLNNPASVSLLSGDRKPQIRF